MTRKDGGTAFPMQDPQAIHAYAQAATEAAKHDNVEDRDQTYIAARAEAVGGLSIRDYFAAKALQAGLSTLQSPSAVASIVSRAADLGVEIEQMFAEDSYRVADAMLAARSA